MPVSDVLLPRRGDVADIGRLTLARGVPEFTRDPCRTEYRVEHRPSSPHVVRFERGAFKPEAQRPGIGEVLLAEVPQGCLHAGLVAQTSSTSRPSQAITR